MKKAFLISFLSFFLSQLEISTFGQGSNGLTAGSEVSNFLSVLASGPDVSLINNYKVIRFPYFVQRNVANCLTGIDESIIESDSQRSRNQLSSDESTNEMELLSCKDLELFNKGVQLFENWNFGESQKLFFNYSKAHPEDKVARYYLALSQLYSGRYGAAASNFSLLNKNLAFAVGFVNPEFKDDVKFYFGISSLMIPEGRKISASLFRQLNYEGGKYQSICKGMIELL